MKTSILSKFFVFIIILQTSILIPSSINAQTISLDTIFITDDEIYPFPSQDMITSLTCDAIIELNSDTSLIRLIVKDINGIEFMIFESYPLISDSIDFSISDYCDESCFLEEFRPFSLIIQVIDATLELKSLYYTTEPNENASQQRFEAKREADASKISLLNNNIPYYDMTWRAGDNSIVELFYQQKKILFGEKYNLLGYDYYKGGIFEFIGHQNYPKVDPDLVWKFDWRNRHGANDSTSAYWDGNSHNTGWLTRAK